MTNIQPLINTVRCRQLRLLGHILKMQKMTNAADSLWFKLIMIMAEDDLVDKEDQEDKLYIYIYVQKLLGNTENNMH